MQNSDATAQRRLYLRASVKALFALGFLFLLIPFFKSLPWPQDEIPSDATVIARGEIAEGETRRIVLRDGTAVFVTRNSGRVREQLQQFPPELLWFPSAPGVADRKWLALRATSMLDEPVRFLPAQGQWPGGFVADSGAAWDVAGRALKPWPGHPASYAVKTQNLLPMPAMERDGALLLLPAP